VPRRVWEAVEIKVGKTGVAKTKREREKEMRRKKVKKRRKEEEKTKKGENNRRWQRNGKFGMKRRRK